MHRQINNLSNTLNHHSNMEVQKENEMSPDIKLKVLGECDLNDRDKLNEIQENSERQFHELRKEINEQKQHFTKETETIKEPNRNSGTEKLNK